MRGAAASAGGDSRGKRQEQHIQQQPTRAAKPLVFVAAAMAMLALCSGCQYVHDRQWKGECYSELEGEVVIGTTYTKMQQSHTKFEKSHTEFRKVPQN